MKRIGFSPSRYLSCSVDRFLRLVQLISFSSLLIVPLLFLYNLQGGFFQIRLDVLVDQLPHRIEERVFPDVCLSDSRTFEGLWTKLGSLWE